MKLGNDLEDFLMSGVELRIIYSSLVNFAWQMYELLENKKNKTFFLAEFKKRFSFALDELGYIENSVVELYKNLKKIYKNLGTVTEEIFFFTWGEYINKKPLIIYTSLQECSKNFEDYEMSIRAGITKEELDKVLENFKKLFPELEDRMSI